jgi:carbamoyltransferase
MTAVLGISAYYHDSAAALIVDGEIVAAAQEERFTRVKHDSSFPTHAVDYCLNHAGLTAAELDYVGFYDKPLLKFDRLLETYLSYAPRGFRSFLKAMPLWMKRKLHIPKEIRQQLGGAYTKRFVFTEHHESHAASAFFPSPYDEAAILTLDGVGEWATMTYGVGRGNRIELMGGLSFPHSVGLLYSAFTSFTGFRVNSGEYKMMGLAPYGEPAYVDTILTHLIDLKDDGSFRLDMSYFNYCQGLTMTSPKMEALFGGPPRQPESEITQREMDIAASIQKVTEEIVLRCARTVHAHTGLTRLVMAGGVALNCVANGRILREGPFDDIWVQPAAGDAGGALGVAQMIWYQLLDNPRTVDGSNDLQAGSLLGPSFDTTSVMATLDEIGAVYTHIDDEALLLEQTAEALADHKVVGWFQGRMEFGPRALGSRSILGDARSAEMQRTMNLKIKLRESFRPFAPSILRERVSDYFEMAPEHESPYMMLVAPLKASRRLPEPATDSGPLTGFAKLSVARSDVPAITHVDGSARVQSVDAQRHGRYYRLLKRFEATTGSPILINTSFNVRGEPIVCSPEHAYRCFMATDMDVLVLEDCVLHKSEQPNAEAHDARDYLSQFALD